MSVLRGFILLNLIFIHIGLKGLHGLLRFCLKSSYIPSSYCLEFFLFFTSSVKNSSLFFFSFLIVDSHRKRREKIIIKSSMFIKNFQTFFEVN